MATTLNATAYNVSDTTSLYCANLYGGYNLSNPAWVIPPNPKNNIIVMTVTQGPNQNAQKFFEFTGYIPPTAFMESCYIYTPWDPNTGTNLTQQVVNLDTDFTNAGFPFLLINQQADEVSEAGNEVKLRLWRRWSGAVLAAGIVVALVF